MKIGVSLGDLLSTRGNYDNSGWMNVDELHFYHKYDYGIAGTLEYQWAHLIIESSYYLGLNNIAWDNWTDLNGVIIENPKAFNRSINFKLSYVIKL